MAQIKIKRGSGVPAGLTHGELAYDVTNRRLYVGVTGASILLANTDGGVSSFNGLTGAVTGVTTGTVNTFQALQSFAAGISASGGGTFTNGDYNFIGFRASTVGGDEGGQIDFGLPATNTGLCGGVVFDVYQNKVRIFESTGTNRGVYIDLAGVSAGVGTNLVGGGGGAVSSVSGSGNGISVSPTTGAVVVQNTGVHSFNGLTGTVTGVTTGTTNTFGPLQSFTNGISASGGTFSGTLRASTINPSTSVSTGGISIVSNSSGSVNITSGSAAGDINLTAGGGGVNIFSQTTPFNISDSNFGIGGKIDSSGAIYIGDYSGNNNGTYVTINDAQMRMSMNSFMDLYAVPNIYFTNGEYIRNSTNGRMDIMPAPSGSTAYGIYFDMTSWGFGVAMGTVRSSDGALNTGGNFRFDVPLTVANDTRFQIGNDGHYGFYRTDTGNNTGQMYAYSNNANNSGAIALVSYFAVGDANRSPATSHTHPNFYIYANGTTSANDFVRFEHNSFNGNIVSGGTTGILIQPGSGQLGISGGICGGAYILNSSGILALTGTTYSLQASDNGEILTMNNGSPITVTVPSGLPVGYSVTVIQLGAGQVSFSASGTTINSYLGYTKIAGQHGSASLVSYSSNVFNLAGSLSA